eukprot:5819759-Karenia_brevis.AAC.1
MKRLLKPNNIRWYEWSQFSKTITTCSKLMSAQVLILFVSAIKSKALAEAQGEHKPLATAVLHTGST